MSSITFDELIQAGLETTSKQLIIKLFEKNKEEFFSKVCANGNVEIVKLLLAPEHGASVNSYHYNPLNAASKKGHSEVVKILIEHGADAKADNNIAIRYASSNGHAEVVKVLIEHGADVKADNNQPIRLASQYGYLGVVKLLIKHGATVTESCLTQATPQVKDYLLSLTAKNKCIYYGIVSEGKLDIKLPDLQEFIKDNLYYYVYECQDKNGCFMVPDIISKHTILSNLNLDIVYSIGFVYDI